MFWLNNTGPMMGRSDRNGTGNAGNRNRWFKSGFSVSTVEKKNVVSPSTNTFSTTPTMIWSTQYLTLKNTSSSPTRAPATGAASTPTYGLPTIDATTAAMKAPPSSCPSMAMWITLVRSYSTPDRAQKSRGTDSARPPTSSEVSEIVAPAPTQVRKAMMNAAPKIDGGHQPTGSRRTARIVACPVSTAMMTVSTHKAGTVGTAVLGISATSPPVAVRNVVTVPLWVNSANPKSATSVKIAIAAGARHLIGGRTSGSASARAVVVASVMPRPPPEPQEPNADAARAGAPGAGRSPAPAGVRRSTTR